MSENENGTTELADDLLYEPFAATKISRNSEKKLFGLNDYLIVGLIRCTRNAMLI